MHTHIPLFDTREFRAAFPSHQRLAMAAQTEEVIVHTSPRIQSRRPLL